MKTSKEYIEIESLKSLTYTEINEMFNRLKEQLTEVNRMRNHLEECVNMRIEELTSKDSEIVDLKAQIARYQLIDRTNYGFID